jgi:hypothetical protein
VKTPAAAAAAIVGLLAIPGALAGADSFTPVGLTVTVAAVARLHLPLKVTVAITADAGVLDEAMAPLRIRVKLASECGGSFPYTPGPVLLDRRLAPQPATGQAYSGQVTGSGRPTSYGVQSVCVFLEEAGDDRQFATDTSAQVNVSEPCTVRASRYDSARKALARAERARGPRRRRQRVAKLRAAARTDHRAALAACGPGVPL